MHRDSKNNSEGRPTRPECNTDDEEEVSGRMVVGHWHRGFKVTLRWESHDLGM